ncbi:MAG TPA: BLUF domain-containing protein [Erythrobacter sp.]|nr:BLUF domain-containing protein [Erythrobacter sp.]
MEQLIYVSLPSASIGGGDVFDIVQKSATRNTARGITGFLLFAEGLFFQCIEGSSLALDGLMADLACDPRHHSITELGRNPISERAYPNWAMKRVYAGNGPSGLVAQLGAMGISPAEIEQVEQFLVAHTARAA